MSKQKRNRGKPADRLSKKTHTISVPRVGAVELSPSRASTTPFCAYYGPHGETCSNTIGLKMVATLPGIPAYQYMACPLHYDAVYQMVQAFLADLENLSKHV